MTADDLVQVHEPIKWRLQLGQRAEPRVVAAILQSSFRGAQAGSTPPTFLHRHQLDAYTRTLSALRVYGGALLCDSVGLGKTYVALGVAKEFRDVLVAVPASIVHQWQLAARAVGVAPTIVSHEVFSRGTSPTPKFDLVVVDEAHRFRNPHTIRYQTLSQVVANAHVLLVTATPVVNNPNDLLHLLRLFLPDHGLAIHGISSLEAALREKPQKPLLKYISPLMTARSAEAAGISGSAIPISKDAPVEAFAPLEDTQLPNVVGAIDGLEFPAFNSQEARQLLRLHLFYRLHSSVHALLSTVRRHRTYIHHALDAARCGSAMSRRDVRSVFDMDDQQLDITLLLAENGHARLDVTRLEIELGRINRLIKILSGNVLSCSPKLECLVRYLETRQSRKTVVFVNAVPTANLIARRLKWSKLILVASGQARISSGRVPLIDAIQLFAPEANHMAPLPKRLFTNVLVTTDVLSEGVNLQDADAVVHYDLPWTSLRLQQRLGRISRMGTHFNEVTVHWFIPPPAIEKRLGLCHRIATKLQYQLQLGVPTTSDVGRARVINHALDMREHIIRNAKLTVASEPCFAVVRGPAVAVYAVQWTLTTGTTYDIVVAAGNGELITDLEQICKILELLFGSEPTTALPSRSLRKVCEEAIRRRLAAATRGPTNHHVRYLTKRIIERARGASKARRFDRLEILDRVLQAVQIGVPVGAESTLREVMQLPGVTKGFEEWSLTYRRKPCGVLDVQIEAALFGDGSVNNLSIHSRQNVNQT